MTIALKYARNGKGPFFVFKFESKDEFEGYVNKLESAVADKDPVIKDSVVKCLDSLRERTDGRYAEDQYPLSGVLFLHEVSDFMFGLSNA